MLVLSRKIGESLMVNNEMEIRIIEISGDKVKIGIEAPKHFRVLRKELCLTMQSNIEAANARKSKELLAFFEQMSGEKGDGEDGQK